MMLARTRPSSSMISSERPSDPDAPRADVHSGLRQQKHQQPEIDSGENEKQSLTPHDSFLRSGSFTFVAVPRYAAPAYW
jgi:hypothetical protein